MTLHCNIFRFSLKEIIVILVHKHHIIINIRSEEPVL